MRTHFILRVWTRFGRLRRFLRTRIPLDSGKPKALKSIVLLKQQCLCTHYFTEGDSRGEPSYRLASILAAERSAGGDLEEQETTPCGDTTSAPLRVKAVAWVRRMRGGAQAHLVRGDDGNFYVVKFSNNPQHRRILVNEWIGSALLCHLQLNTACPALVEMDVDFLHANPEVRIHQGKLNEQPPPGCHFGSRYPGNPSDRAVYDFLPDLLLPKIGNIGEYAGALVFDQWTGNADARQTVFYRAAVEGTDNFKPPRNRFVALLIDNGFVFGGPEWAFHDSPSRGLYHRPQVYAKIQGWSSFEPWIERLRHFPEEIIDRALRSLPPHWVGTDGDELEALLERLMRRRARVSDLIEAVRDSHSNPFPDWK